MSLYISVSSSVPRYITLMLLYSCACATALTPAYFFLFKVNLKDTAQPLQCNVKTMSVKLPQEEVWKGKSILKKSSDAENSERGKTTQLAFIGKNTNRTPPKIGGKGRKISLSTRQRVSRVVWMAVSIQLALFYGHNSSPSILGLQVIDYGRLNIMWILFVPLCRVKA